MTIIKATIRCIATYETELDLPDDAINGNIQEYIETHLPETTVNNLTFSEDLDEDFLVSYQIVNTPDATCK